MIREQFDFIPAGTTMDRPDDGNKVILTFISQDEAIIFYERMLSITAGEQVLRIGAPSLLDEVIAEDEEEDD